jgi:hypothetical protein
MSYDLLDKCISLIIEAVDINRVLSRVSAPANIGNIGLYEFQYNGAKTYILYSTSELLKRVEVAKSYKQLNDLVENGLDRIILAAAQTETDTISSRGQKINVKELKYFASNMVKAPLMLAIVLKDCGAIIPDRSSISKKMHNLINTYWNSIKSNTKAWAPIDKSLENIKLRHLISIKRSPLDNVYFDYGINVPINSLRETNKKLLHEANKIYTGPEKPASAIVDMALRANAIDYLNTHLST